MVDANPLLLLLNSQASGSHNGTQKRRNGLTSCLRLMSSENISYTVLDVGKQEALHLYDLGMLSRS
jgi:hypothetical protein